MVVVLVRYTCKDYGCSESSYNKSPRKEALLCCIFVLLQTTKSKVVKNTDTQDNLLELVDILQQVDETAPCSRLNQYSMRNCYLKGIRGDDSELRTWFYHYKTLKKNGIIRSNEKMEGQARKPKCRVR